MKTVKYSDHSESVTTTHTGISGLILLYNNITPSSTYIRRTTDKWKDIKGVIVAKKCNSQAKIKNRPARNNEMRL